MRIHSRLLAHPAALTALTALAAVTTVAASACKGGTNATSAGDAATPIACHADTTSTLALPIGECARVASARVRSGGAWRDVSLSAVTVTAAPGGAASITTEVAGGAEAFELTLLVRQKRAMLQEGYQSWSFSGATSLAAAGDAGSSGDATGKAASTGDPLDEVLGTSYGAALVGDPGGAGVAIATSSSDVASTVIRAANGTASNGDLVTTVKVLYGPTFEPLPAGADGKYALAPILVASADQARQALVPVVAGIKAALPVTARAPRRPVGGWYSWNELFDKVTEADVTAHATIVASTLLPKGMPLLEIDDGWEVAWGDWRANAKFPSGMDGVGKAITAKGLKAGIWLAPFLVDVTSDVAKSTDPSLFVQGPDGKPLQHKPSGSLKLYYVLDGTNPASMALVTASIASLAADGFTFFKLDFLYAGALPGVRKDPKATGTQALHAGLVALRAAMGDSATLNACGAPIFPLLGYADSMRIGSDTAYAAASLNWGDVVFAARSTAARSFLGSMVWLDGDQTQVREPYTTDEARVSAFVAALSGPAYALGDDLRTLPAERLAIALDPQVLDLTFATAPAVPADPLETPADAIVTSPVLDAIANPGSTGAPPPTVWVMTGKSGVTHTLTFSWTDVHSAKEQ